MRNLLIFLAVMMVSFSCSRAGEETGLIPNPSAEKFTGSSVAGWNSETRAGGMIAFYDYEAHEGRRSLMLQSNQPAGGRWMTRVMLKPWSTYRFTGWVKTEGVQVRDGRGAGFRFDAFDAEYTGLTGTNDWTRIEFTFSTGNDDSSVLSLLLGIDGPASGRAWFDDMALELISTEKISTAITVDLTDRKEPMSEYIYGQFIEHLGRCIYGGIWAEMLEDRKFWYTPGSRESPWVVRGRRELFSVDRNSPYTGEQTPVLGADASGAASIMQHGLGLKPDLDYNGHIVLKATPGITAVKVTLRWEEHSETVSIENLSGSFASYPLEFHSGGLTHNASIVILPEGIGRVWVGTASLMPGDNIEGFRSDVIALLRELDAPVYRWPGGNFVSGYDWKDGIGDRDRRPPRKNPAWQGVEHNDVGIHEFMTFCEILDTEPYIAVNAGLGDSKQAREEVEYCNGSSDTPMGRLRAANGHPEPWNVKWWSIGNEMYGDWQLGHMSTADFVKKHNDFAETMRSVDPSIVLIAVGELGEWDRMVLANCSESMDMISEHFYRQDWHGGGLMTHVKQIADAIREKADAHRLYRQEIPQLKGKDIRICMDEWNYWYGPHIYGELGTRYFMRDAMGIAAGLNEYARQSDMIFMANYAQTVNVIGCIKTNSTGSVFDATGQVLKLYRQKFGRIPVGISGETRPLDIAATIDPEGKKLMISVVNATYDKVNLPIRTVNGSISASGELWQVTAPDDMATNEPERPEAVTVSGPVTISAGRNLTIAPASINLFVFDITD